MRKSIFGMLPVLAFLLLFMGTGVGDNISNIQISPNSPASLSFNQNVEISFDYTTDQTAGVRIFARPFSGGSLAPNYAASGSPNYPVGSGSGTTTFTIKSGEVTVDQIRFRVYNNDQSVLILEFFVPVEIHFASHSISNIQLSPSSPTSLAFNENVSISFDYTTDEASGVRIFARPFSGGSLTPNYSASGSPTYAVGSGSGTATFTIQSGDTTVDQIRFQMLNNDQSQLLLEFFVPVEYHFAAHSVSNIQLSPPSPASLALGQNVDISFDYTTEEAGGVRIFIRPFSDGSLAPGFGASGSPNYPVGSGSGTASFTINSGNVTVDQLRIQMLNNDQSVLLQEFFIPVEYHFSSHSISNIELSPSSPAYSTFNQNVEITFDYTTDEAGGVHIFARPFSDGSPAPNYAAHGSPLYSVGSGSGSGYFTIKSGDVIVDQIRFRMVNSDQSILLLEFFVPVTYHYGTTTFPTDIPLTDKNLQGPQTYALLQNYPNPFNPSTTIKYYMQRSGSVNISIFNTAGQEIERLVDSYQPAGEHEVQWVAKGLPSGIYFYKMQINDFSQTRKLILLK